MDLKTEIFIADLKHFINSLYYDRVVHVNCFSETYASTSISKELLNDKKTYKLHTETEVREITREEYDAIPPEERERVCTEHCKSFEGYTSRNCHFNSDGVHELSEKFTLEKSDKDILPRTERYRKLMDFVKIKDLSTFTTESQIPITSAVYGYKYSTKNTKIPGDLIFGILEDGRFTKWFMASEQFFLFFKTMKKWFDTKTVDMTLEQAINGNCKLIANTWKKRIINCKLNMDTYDNQIYPPFKVLRYENISKDYLHVYVKPIVEIIFNNYTILPNNFYRFENNTIIRNIPVEWDVPV
jgi:hypothetical protein